WFSAVADLTGAYSGSINGGGQGLSLVAFTAGPRFTYPVHRRYAPFVQALVGAAHGFDSYFPVSSGATGAANGFAMLAGGGLDIRTKSWLAIRPIQADYFLTQLPNGSNDRQNNLRISAGLVLRLW
ncbi:MAG: OmpA family protein, partial [Acidobacteriaceae bacterium]